LRPGSGNYYQVTIEAIADPKPPSFPPEDLAGDLRQKIERLLAQLRDVSEGKCKHLEVTHAQALGGHCLVV
jgi:hypothetical protein